MLTPPAHTHTLGEDLCIALDAAACAGQVVLDGYQRLEGPSGSHATGCCGPSGDRSMTFEAKGVGDLVSEVDREADRQATRAIRRHSGAPILSEELQPEVNRNCDDLWIVDPLDGSGAYLMRVSRELPSVLVARRRRGETVCGVCLFPLTGEWFYAVRGQGAWKNGQPLRIAGSAPSLSEVWVETNRYGDARHETPRFQRLTEKLRSPRGAGLVTCNTAYSGVAVRIAEGRSSLAAAIHDNCPQRVKQAAWDIAAPQLILEEAGGVFWNFAGKPADPFGGEPLLLARSQQMAEEILALDNVCTLPPGITPAARETTARRLAAR
ncbi:MAG: inositol monophosphatase [Planctomycetales bacterium]|nr:inositol monophosphatase [Planctomycetales bacterium]